MYSNYIYTLICTGMNSAIFLYSNKKSLDKYTPAETELYMLLLVALIPGGMMLLSAFSKKDRSKIITYCALLTIISGILFTLLYASSSETSKVIVLAPHYILTYLFASITMAAYGNKA